MKAADVNINLVDSYFTLLKNLSPNNKLELISRLSKSLKTTTKKKNDNFLDELYGSWVSVQSADELVEELKKARNFSSKREELCKNIFSTPTSAFIY
ncbi:MAG: hypothetical protein R2760_10875 [Chitinophagales bacterium]|nr:hypothetical protein [Bacteroidota bacterium]MCB9074020.1 hypothetical protein [Chitinophagales bacterium]